MQNLPAYQKMGVIATLASLLAVSVPAQAFTLIGNYSSTNDNAGTTINQGGNFQKAVGFTLSTGNDYTLDSIRLRLSGYDTTGGDVALLQIYADTNRTSNNPNEATLQSVLFNYPSSSSVAAGNFDFTPTSAFTFLNNIRYWLLVDATAGVYEWSSNNPNVTPTGVSGIVFNSYQFSNNNGSSYSSSSAVLNSFEINATELTAVPFEFNPALGLGVLGGLWLLRKGLKKKSTKV